jgi:hypothetical protein
MDRTALVEELVMSEKNNSIVEIKIINTDRLVVGAVQKVLNQIIILKSVAAEPVTLTFADIESVKLLTDTFVDGVLQKILKRIHRFFRPS